MRGTVIAIRRRCGGNGGQDGWGGRAPCVLTELTMGIGAAEISLGVLVVVRGLRNARKQDGNGHRPGDTPTRADA
jgi:hypothetical protein